MENKEKISPEVNKVIDTLTKELESLNAEELHEFFKFFYKMNHNQANMISPDNFEEFLEAFDINPFKAGDDKKFRKQLIDNIIKYGNIKTRYNVFRKYTNDVFVEYDFMVQKPLKSYIIRLLGKSPRSEALSKHLMQRDDGTHRRR